MITQSELKELLHYDPVTGIFTWLISQSNRVKVGDIAGGISKRGYFVIRIHNIINYSHRLAWFYVYGINPIDEIDHINMIKIDNRIANLRQANSSENKINKGLQSNNTSGYKGVCWCKQHRKWVARCYAEGKPKHLGLFDNKIDAYTAYVCFAKQQHGEFFHA